MSCKDFLRCLMTESCWLYLETIQYLLYKWCLIKQFSFTYFKLLKRHGMLNCCGYIKFRHILDAVEAVPDLSVSGVWLIMFFMSVLFIFSWIKEKAHRCDCHDYVKIFIFTIQRIEQVLRIKLCIFLLMTNYCERFVD
jgi:hypothetical protein